MTLFLCIKILDILVRIYAIIITKGLRRKYKCHPPLKRRHKTGGLVPVYLNLQLSTLNHLPPLIPFSTITLIYFCCPKQPFCSLAFVWIPFPPPGYTFKSFSSPLSDRPSPESFLTPSFELDSTVCLSVSRSKTCVCRRWASLKRTYAETAQCASFS